MNSLRRRCFSLKCKFCGDSVVLFLKMITLSKKLKKPQEQSGVSHSRISVRDKLLAREAQEMDQLLPRNCTVTYGNHNDLSSFLLTVNPTDGYWRDGSFTFTVHVTEEYNMVPPIVKCITKLWHPNISEQGDVCLSLLRQYSVDGSGWSPTRRLKDVVWGLHDLFTDLCNFDDPLNTEAADMFKNSKLEFEAKVTDYVKKYARD